MRPGFGSGTQRSGSGFEAPEGESETGTLGQSEFLQYLAKNLKKERKHEDKSDSE